MSKILQDSEIEKAKSNGTVLVGGCFDVLHPGHLEFLKLSKSKGNNLVVLLESDENVRKMKGEKRPLNNQLVRAENISNIQFVDAVILLKKPESSQYYYNLVKLLEPDIIAVTSLDPLIKVKKDQAKMVGGKVVEVMKRDLRYSTTKMV